MGLAASQARYLALTARKDDLEYQSQIINTRRLQLAYKTADIARAYSEGMNNKIIAISSAMTNKTSGQTTTVWNELTFDNLIGNGEYAIIGTNGTGIYPAPYFDRAVEKDEYRPNKAYESITKAEYDKLSPGKQQVYVVSVWEKAPTKNEDGTETAGVPLKYKLKSPIDAVEYANITKVNPEGDPPVYKDDIDYINNHYTEDTYTIHNLSVNEKYSQENGMDIQTLLVSGKAQIVTKAFYNYLVDTYSYNYESGITPQQYAKALDDWKADENNQVNPDGAHSVVDWRADENSGFKQRYYTEDDADVLARYEAETAEVQAQDKMLEVEEKNIETQHKAIETEMESIKKVIQKNIEDTFKIFS